MGTFFHFCSFYVIILDMENLSLLAQRILELLDSNPKHWSYWTNIQELSPVSKSESMQQFVYAMKDIKEKKEKVFIAGDYDCDGILATTIMVDGLRRYGIECGFYIPDRIREGYGLSEQTVLAVYKKGYKNIVTVDNGVKAFDALAYAKEFGIKTIVTDHHTIEEEVDCDILVHPDTLENCFSTLCGAGVAYECMRALEVDTTYHLELAAIASIGDVMSVTNETRALIQQGLKELNQTQETHVFSLASSKSLDETGLGFQVIPKLNAIGRLSNLANVNNVVRYFLSDNRQDIYHFTQQMNQINERRKKMSQESYKFAKTKCIAQDKVLVISDASFHEGIIGLVANSLCNEYGKPSIVLTENQDGLKASMRSPNGFDCMEFLKDFEHFTTFGGHSNAAGFSLNLQDFQEFKKYIRIKSSTYKWRKKKEKTLLIQPEEITIDSIKSLDVLRPFGPDFEFPLFEINQPNIKSFFDIQNGKHRRYTLTSGLQCMVFNQSDAQRNTSVNKIQSFIGKAQISQYQGKEQLTFVIESINYL